MRLLIIYSVLCVASAAVVRAAEVLRPRGVELYKASFYDPSRDFHCLDGSGSIPFNYVNDDYCDCQDGSDEPGTAACPNGFFHCTNSGHIPLTIPSSRVNDGVCDCCDTSDEYASGAQCVDVCREMGRAAREEAARMKEERARGYHLREEMVEEGKRKKKEGEAKIEELKREKEQAESLKVEKEELKKSAEEPEKEALEKYRAKEDERKEEEGRERKEKEDREAMDAFEHLDNDGDGVLTVEELKSRQTFDTNRDGQVTDEEARFYLGQEDTMSLDTFLATGWAMMRPIYMMDRRMFTPPSTTVAPEIDELTPPPPVFDEEDTYGTDEDDDDDDYDPSTDNEEGDAEEFDTDEERLKEEGEEEEEKEEEEKEEEPKYDEETQKLVDVANQAREEFDEADRRVRDLTRELRSLEEAQGKDYGPQEEFRAMEGQCYEFTDREYIYRLCPFDKAVQKPKSGHGETRLGQWGEWTGGEDNKYSRQLYSNGQACWNGPTRSADIQISCGTETRINSVTEPNRCEYVFMMSTPAACTTPDDSNIREEEEDNAYKHTEL